jgi:hypothetical protein
MALTRPGIPRQAAPGAGHDFAKAKSLLAHATWIAAEIPQDLHGQIQYLRRFVSTGME